MDTNPTAGMGSAFRSTPLSTPLQHVDVGISAVGDGSNKLRSTMAGHSSIQGWRSSMEDKYIIDDLMSVPKHSLVAVFDGHAGSECAAFCSNNLVDLLQNTPSWKLYRALHAKNASAQHSNKNVKNKFKKNNVDGIDELNQLLSQALVETYIQLDFEFLKSMLPKNSYDSNSNITSIDELAKTVDEEVLNDIQENMTGGGCTAVCSLITPDSVIVANCGDSRCLISSTAVGDIPVSESSSTDSGSNSGLTKKTKRAPDNDNTANGYSYTSVAMTDDHKPSNDGEQERVMAAGGQVWMDRVDGSLAMSRAIGDFR